MSRRPPLAMTEVDDLLSGLDVEAVAFTECALQSGWGLTFGPHELPSLHYVLEGEGAICLADSAPVALPAGCLVISPPGRGYRLEVAGAPSNPLSQVAGSEMAAEPGGEFHRNYAGATMVDTLFVCGHFRARHPAAVGLFTSIETPIVVRFGPDETPGVLLALLREELREHQVGMRAMASALLKQILVRMFRRAMVSSEVWRERITLLGDPQVARAFVSMRADPAATHSIGSLAATACLSRSAFIARFTRTFGVPPSTLLRRLRLDRAEELLRDGRLSGRQVASLVGYVSYSSFSRADLKRHELEAPCRTIAASTPATSMPDRPARG